MKRWERNCALLGCLVGGSVVAAGATTLLLFLLELALTEWPDNGEGIKPLAAQLSGLLFVFLVLLFAITHGGVGLYQMRCEDEVAK